MNDLRIVSADDHVIEPPELWQNHVPRRLRDLAPKVVRIAVNRSLLHHTLVSWEMDTGMSWRRTCQVGGYPCPALCSDSVETETEPPDAAMRW